MVDIYLLRYRSISPIKYFSFLSCGVKGQGGKPGSRGAERPDCSLTGASAQGPYANPRPQNLKCQSKVFVTAGDHGGIVMMIGRVLPPEMPFPEGSGAKTRGSSHHLRVYATGRRDE